MKMNCRLIREGLWEKAPLECNPLRESYYIFVRYRYISVVIMHCYCLKHLQTGFTVIKLISKLYNLWPESLLR